MAFIVTVYLLILHLLVGNTSKVYALSDVEMFQVLLSKIEKLEMRDVANKREIAALKSEMGNMKTTFLKIEENYVAEINKLKSRLRNDEKQPGLYKATTLPDGEEAEDIRKTRKMIRSLHVRTPVETEVAFYATHSQHDVRHLTKNQIIVFDQVATNIGNGYDPINGSFVAPVAGTYVFHVTMMGKDVHNVTWNHFVDGKTYSRLWVEPYDQSSQMFVIELQPGKTVSVKNSFLDNGFIGQHFSSFSGFLLYEHRYFSAILGK